MTNTSNKIWEIRDPIYGFISIDDWERQIIDSEPFQRLRRIRQLALTDMVYPGAMHTRFEHSLGVMHIATLMYDAIWNSAQDFLMKELGYNNSGMERTRALVRIAALLHDVGHSAFSHAGEALMEMKTPKEEKHYKHEDYTVYIIRNLMRDVIENHFINEQNYKISADDVADLLEGNPRLGVNLFWKDLISGQVGADRIDYLLRDSYHIGVQYGVFDYRRLLATITAVKEPDTELPTIAFEEGGLHVAESLILARYQMFTQVYFQHSRRAFDHHIEQAIKELLLDNAGIQSGRFLPPISDENVKMYLTWDDWKVLGLIHNGFGGEDACKIRERNHDCCVYHTPEIPTKDNLDIFNELEDELGSLVSFVDSAQQSWYNIEKGDVPILLKNGRRRNEIGYLSRLSNVVSGLKPIMQKRIYVARKNKEIAIKKIAKSYRRDGEHGY